MSETSTPAPNPPSTARILIVGNAGQLGRELQRIFAGIGTMVAVDRESVDLADADQTRALVRHAAPGIILNAAAHTAVDRAESERDLAYAINEQAPRVLAEEALARNALLVHYSTDYVFNGTKPEPWIETDAPDPLNVYGASKLAGERAVENIGGRYLIFRTSWVYGPRGNNFLLTMLRLARQRDRLSIVDDQVGAPTTSHRARTRHSRHCHRHPCRPLWRSRGLGWPLPHDLRWGDLLVWICTGHLRSRRRAAGSKSPRTHSDRHQRLSHSRRASAQLGPLQRQVAIAIRFPTRSLANRPRRNTRISAKFRISRRIVPASFPSVFDRDFPHAHSPCRMSGSTAPVAVTPSISNLSDPIIQST